MRALLLGLVVLGCASVARADDGLRCGERLVNAGESEADVAAKCGPPTSSATHRCVWRLRGGTLRVTQDTWIYDRGPSEFVRTLHFEDGTLAGVDVGSWGH